MAPKKHHRMNWVHRISIYLPVEAGGAGALV
jgi:hypothetical protein